MELGGTCRLLYGGYVVGAYARAGHDYDARCGLLYEFGYEGCALYGRGLLARGEQTVAPEPYDLFEGRGAGCGIRRRRGGR